MEESVRVPRSSPECRFDDTLEGDLYEGRTLVSPRRHAGRLDSSSTEKPLPLTSGSVPGNDRYGKIENHASSRKRVQPMTDCAAAHYRTHEKIKPVGWLPLRVLPLTEVARDQLAPCRFGACNLLHRSGACSPLPTHISRFRRVLSTACKLSEELRLGATCGSAGQPQTLDQRQQRFPSEL